ncbi:MAG: hypothetical protein M3O80_04515 [Chloroflexota bacterium]|nr:hypothetical protein [Chloroflexota bacterium]
MRRFVLVFAISLLSLASFGTQAAAKCAICLDGLSVQNPDGQPWSQGKPVTLVASVRRGEAGVTLPADSLAVIMQADRERTKCINVPLKLVSQSGDGALYAGLFYPYRAAVYTGLVQFGDSTFEMTVDTNTMTAIAGGETTAQPGVVTAAAVSAPVVITPLATAVINAKDLPAAPREEPVAETLSYTLGNVPFILLALGFWSIIGLALMVRQVRNGAAVAR